MAQVLSNLPIGAKIKFGKHSVNGETAQDIIWTLVAKNHPGYASNSITFLTSKIIDLRAFDVQEPNSAHSERMSYGNNDYDVSNIDQWLNKSEEKWFVAAHTYDQAPINKYLSAYLTGYDGRPGFLSNFTEKEVAAILSTPITFAKWYNSLGSVNRKIFLPSSAEVGYEGTDGTKWEYFNSSTRDVGMTTQCLQNTNADVTNMVEEVKHYWWLRSAVPTSSYQVGMVAPESRVMSATFAARGDVGVRPAMNLSSTQKVSDTTDSDGCYTIVHNTAPIATSVSTAIPIYGGRAFFIEMFATDPDGDEIGVELQRQLNGSTAWVEHFKSDTWTSLAQDTVPFGTTKVRYRFRVTDSKGESSEWVYTDEISVINNSAPTISGLVDDLGIMTTEFFLPYTVYDNDGDTPTITESIDGVLLRSYSIPANTGDTLSITGTTWLKLANGNHTITITAKDGINTTVKTIRFTKAVDILTIQTHIPMVAGVMPTRIKINVVRNIPAEAKFKVEVCNNGYDANPTWEDATTSVIGSLPHIFQNDSEPTAGKWGVLIRVTVERNGGSGACYVSSIEGAFD